MPELPEVETIRRGLATAIVGKIIRQVEVFCPKSFIGNLHTLTSVKLVQVSRRGKLLIITGAAPEIYITIHLRMTGQLIYVGAGSSERFAGGHPTDSLEGPLPDRHTRVSFEFTDGSHLYFNDQRKFGFVHILTAGELARLPFIQQLGPEPLDPAFTTNQFIARFANKQRSSIKAALLDQHVVAGVGNIYADESLFLAQLHPATLVSALLPADFDRLLTAIRACMTASIDSGGSTMATYRRPDGSKGDYLEKFANVFRRAGLACPVCGDIILKIKVAGRGTHYCPTCQPLRVSPTSFKSSRKGAA
jgi:formamidopyrimidine-DNA glycosylase